MIELMMYAIMMMRLHILQIRIYHYEIFLIVILSCKMTMQMREFLIYDLFIHENKKLFFILIKILLTKLYEIHSINITLCQKSENS